MYSKQTILLVDDSENDLLLMRAAFELAGTNPNILEVRSGEEAIAFLKGDGPYADRSKYPLPTVMLLDLNMPKTSGFEVLAWVRSQPKIKRLTVMILTSSMRKEDVERAFDLGASSFLVKPSDLNGLASMMRCLCEWVRINQFPPLGEAVPAPTSIKSSVSAIRIKV